MSLLYFSSIYTFYLQLFVVAFPFKRLKFLVEFIQCVLSQRPLYYSAGKKLTKVEIFLTQFDFRSNQATSAGRYGNCVSGSGGE